MALIVETGIGIEGAESYATVAQATAYWGKRTNNALATAWSALATDALREGALREASAHLDAVYGSRYQGIRRGYIQGLLWPRSGTDDAGTGLPLPALPNELVTATIELAARAASAPLVVDVDPAKLVKSESKSVGPLSKSVTYATSEGSAATIGQKSYGSIESLLSPILKGDGAWAWA